MGASTLFRSLAKRSTPEYGNTGKDYAEKYLISTEVALCRDMPKYEKERNFTIF